MSATDIIVRTAAGSGSVLLFYLAWFVYEDEERILQNKIDDWWIEFDSLRQRMVSRHMAFVRVVSELSNQFLDRIFGRSLLSFDSIAAALCLSFASLLLVFDAMAVWVGAEVGITVWWGALEFLVPIGVSFAPKTRQLKRALLGGLISFSVVSLNFDMGLLLPVVAGAGFILLIAAVAQKWFSLIVEGRGGLAPAGILVAFIAPLCTIPPFVLIVPLVHNFGPGSWMYVVGSGRLTTTILMCLTLVCSAGLLLVVVAALMLVHRALWPLLSRGLYALPRHKIIENKKWLNAMAVALVGIAWSGSEGWHQLAKYIGL